MYDNFTLSFAVLSLDEIHLCVGWSESLRSLAAFIFCCFCSR